MVHLLYSRKIRVTLSNRLRGVCMLQPWDYGHDSAKGLLIVNRYLIQTHRLKFVFH